MGSIRQQLQSEITASERAIRQLIGEQAALNSRLARTKARLKLEQTRLASLGRNQPPILQSASRFPDVSNWQSSVNVAQVRQASSVRVGDLLVTKLTEGTSYVDAQGIQRLKDMAAANFTRRGAYAFLHPSESGQAQAEHFVQTLEAGGVKFGTSDIVIADLEVSDGMSSASVRACGKDFAATIRQHNGDVRLWLYGGGPFLKENGVPLDGYEYHWLPAYVGNPAPYIIYGSRLTKAWQFTDGQYGPNPHSCPGIGQCDMSIVLV